MSFSIRSVSLAAALLAASVASPAFADIKMVQKQATRDIILQEVKAPGSVSVSDEVKIDEMNRRDFEVSFAGNKSGEGDMYTFDDKIEFTFSAKKDCYLTVLDFTPTGDLVVLYPNQWAQDNFVKADQQIRIPPENAKFEMKSGGPVGTDRVTVIASTKPEKVIDIDAKKITNAFAVIDDRKAATRQIVIVAKEDEQAAVPAGDQTPVSPATPASPDTQTAVQPVDPAVPPTQPPATPDAPVTPAEPKANVTATPEADKLEWSVAHLAVHNRSKEDAGSFAMGTQNGWVVKCWTDKPDFKAQEKLVIRMQSNQACQIAELTNKGASGNTNTLLPEGKAVDLKPEIINVLPGAGHAFIYEASEPAGADVIIAKLKNEKGDTMELTVNLKTAN